MPFADRQNTTTTTQSTHHKPRKCTIVCCCLRTSFILVLIQSRLYAEPAAKPAKKQSWIDIDEKNKDNPLACSEYAEAIFQHLNTAEVRT